VVVTAVVAWVFFRWTSMRTEAEFRKASAETRTMLRTFALTLEQVGKKLGIPIKFLRDEHGEIDLDNTGEVMGEGGADLPGLGASGKGTVE
jgi:hypothetical protein